MGWPLKLQDGQSIHGVYCMTRAGVYRMAWMNK
jgi:hypothetical protein